MMPRSLVAVGLILLPLVAALAGCEARPQFASYRVDRACTEAGFARGTTDYDSCVAAARVGQVHAIHDLAVRAALREPVGVNR